MPSIVQQDPPMAPSDHHHWPGWNWRPGTRLDGRQRWLVEYSAARSLSLNGQLGLARLGLPSVQLLALRTPDAREWPLRRRGRQGRGSSTAANRWDDRRREGLYVVGRRLEEVNSSPSQRGTNVRDCANGRAKCRLGSAPRDNASRLPASWGLMQMHPPSSAIAGFAGWLREGTAETTCGRRGM